MGRTVVRLEETASTMDDARVFAEAGEPSGTVVVARRQRKGRGRGGRSWESPEGGLWFTLVHRPRFGVDVHGLVPLAAGLGVARALHRQGLDPRLKWPNDVLVRGRKIAGVLAEAHLAPAGDRAAYVLVGVGINANNEPDDLPPDVARGATSMKRETRRTVELDRLLESVVGAVTRELGRLDAGGRDAVLQDVRTLCDTPGREVRVDAGGRVVEGRAVEVATDGALVVRTADGINVRVETGDVADAGPTST